VDETSKKRKKQDRPSSLTLIILSQLARGPKTRTALGAQEKPNQKSRSIAASRLHIPFLLRALFFIPTLRTSRQDVPPPVLSSTTRLETSTHLWSTFEVSILWRFHREGSDPYSCYCGISMFRSGHANGSGHQEIHPHRRCPSQSRPRFKDLSYVICHNISVRAIRLIVESHTLPASDDEMRF
jgi:hypothetical protein